MSKIADLGTALIIVAGLLVLTRPGSQGSKFIEAVGGAFAGAVGVATGQSVTTAGVRAKGYGTRARRARPARRRRAA